MNNEKLIEEDVSDRHALIDAIGTQLADDYKGITDAVLAAGFRRPEVQEPSECQSCLSICANGRHCCANCDHSETQGEPSDAQGLLDEADALIDAWDRKGSWSPDSPIGLVMRLAAALRAAGGVR